MDHQLISFSQIFKKTLSVLPDFGTILRGIAILATAKPDKFQSIPGLVEKHAEKQPNHPAIKYKDKIYTYGELNTLANRYAHYLQSCGLKKGDAVALMIDNRPEVLIAALAILKLGAIASMINTSQREKVLLHSLTLIDCKMVIAGQEHIDAVKGVMPLMEESTAHRLKNGLFYLADDELELTQAQENDLDKTIDDFRDLNHISLSSATSNLAVTQRIQLKDPCYYVFTSGTTGLPKASVMSTFRWFKCMGGIGIASLRLKRDDVFYIPLPFYHNNALTVSLGAVLGAGATVAISRKFSASRFWDEIRHYKATGFCYIGELCRYLLNKPEKANDSDHSVRVIIGNGLRADIWEEFQQRFGIERINEFYGASECNLMFTNAANIEKTAGFTPLAYQIVKYDIDNDEVVRDANGLCIPVEAGETGLLITAITKRSPFDGYTDKAASNKKILTNVLEKGDQYFNTGDLVFNQGYRHICFVDRLGDTFRWKGENVATTEVESAVAQFDGIEHAVVYGVDIPHTDGKAGMASISLKEDISNEGLNKDQVWNHKNFAAHIDKALPPYAAPLFIRVQPQQEVTGTFKYQKTELKKQGFDLALCPDPIYVRLPNSDDYTRVDDNIAQQIQQGEFSF